MEENTLVRFLENCKGQLGQIHTEPVPLHVVLGNESADLDSVVSTLVYAFLLYKNEVYPEKAILPVINTQASSIHLRTEVTAVFDKYKIPEEILIFIDEINLTEMQRLVPLTVTLVDHNVLSPELSYLRESVMEIIDHHEDEQHFVRTDVTKTILAVGSCCTLVAEKVINQNGDLLKLSPVSDLLLCTILGDTQNLSAEAGRGSEFDVEVCEELQAYVGQGGDELYHFVHAAKFDISGLSSVDILRKDFKFLTGTGSSITGGVSSITMECSLFFSRDETVRSVVTYCSVQKLDFLVMMFIWTSIDVTKRELVLFSVNDSLRTALSVYLTSCAELEVIPSETLHGLEDNARKYFISLAQANVKASRKILMPLLTGFLQSSIVRTIEEREFRSTATKILRNQNNNFVPLEAQTEFHLHGGSHGSSEEKSRRKDENEMFGVGNSTPREGVSDGKEASKDSAASFKDEEHIRKIEKELELFENEKNNPALGFMNQKPHLRTQSEMEFEQILYGSTSSDPNFNDVEQESSMDRRDSFIRKLVNEAYAADEAELKQSFEGEWDQESGLKRSSVSSGKDAKALIYIKELSFDFEEHPDVHGSDVFAPVFLAVTEEDDDEEEEEDEGGEEEGPNDSQIPWGAKRGAKSEKLGLRNMRKKAQSIENLCVVLGSSDSDLPSMRSRSKSDLPLKFRRKSAGKRQDKKVTQQRSFDDNFCAEFDNEQRETHRRTDRLGRKFYSQETGLDSDDPFPERETMVRFQDVQDLRDGEAEDISSLSEGRLEFEETSANPSHHAVRRVSHNTSAMLKSVERLYFDENDDQRAAPDGSSEETHESKVTYVATDTPHVRGLWNRYIAVNVGIQQRIIDLELIEPYMKVISHGGCCYSDDQKKTVMVFTACYLPNKGVRKYDIIMEQLFYYVIHTLDLLVQDDYIIVYFNSGIDSLNMPKRSWLRDCYHMIDRRLKKSLSALYFVHPNFWLRAMVKLYRPFISGKFYHKIKLISTLRELESNLSTEYIFIPEEVRRADPDILHLSRTR